ncbi:MULTISPECIES: hypothetical protein [unclassified Fibrobacter]|uniref:hypothetical protein n=1 Tax=unclassified Fibrobacter TaxID=2634177 RepID=UPI000D6A938A|nr:MULTISPECIES: hypothetical protein [unclassified Fibrobacter]PWJ69091.1 hypothetical protein BGX12_10555 [Fibrobacter sp. UWR4]PZW72922.1 hypothetical protein C8E88_100555 [Fibrobacter sp. UWR1]
MAEQNIAATTTPEAASVGKGAHAQDFMQKMKDINDKKMKCSLDSAELVSVKGELEKVQNEFAEYKVKSKELVVNGQKKVETLTKQLQEAQAKQSPITALTSPSGCAVLVVLILCITLIAMKKGVKISKGNTNVSIGEGETKK